MIKCSFFNQRNVYQSFCGTLLTLSYFLLQGKVPGKVLCFGSRVGKSVLRDVYCLKRSEDLVEEKLYDLRAVNRI